MEIEIINIKCEKCGNEKSYKKKLDNLEYGECTSCGNMTYSKFISSSPSIVRCPYCNSYDVKKITKTSKAISIAFFGILAIGKAEKQWHCNKCKSDF